MRFGLTPNLAIERASSAEKIASFYLRQGLVAESSRDAEFSLDNTLFRFGMRWDVAIVEPNQIKKFAA